MTKPKRKPKFSKGQVVCLKGHFGYYVVDVVWMEENMPQGYSKGPPLYQLHADPTLVQLGRFVYREPFLRPLTAKEIGPRRRKA